MNHSSDKLSSFKQKAKSTFKKMLAIAIIILIGVILFFYYANISNGSRAGVIVKISERGVLFKTYEGQIDIGSFGAVKDVNQLSQTFQFSVEKGDTHIYEAIEKASLTGERVQIKYKEKYGILPWRGETTYFVYEVVTNPNAKQENKKSDFPNS